MQGRGQERGGGKSKEGGEGRELPPSHGHRLARKPQSACTQTDCDLSTNRLQTVVGLHANRLRLVSKSHSKSTCD